MWNGSYESDVGSCARWLLVCAILAAGNTGEKHDGYKVGEPCLVQFGRAREVQPACRRGLGWSRSTSEQCTT